MLPGFNHNVRFKNRVYHVQTEDIGLKIASVVTQVFLAGQVLALEKTSYQDLLDAGWGETDRVKRIRLRMQEQHKTLLKRVTEGVFETQVEALITDGIATADLPSSPPRPRSTPPERAPLGNPPSTRPAESPPTFAEAATIITDERTLRFEEDDFLSSLDAEVRRHIEATDPSLPPFDSSILPAEPPPILPQATPGPRTGTQPPRVVTRPPRIATQPPRTGNQPRLTSSMSNSPLRTRRPRPARDTLVDEPSPLLNSGLTPPPDARPAAGKARSNRPVRFRRPTSSTAVPPLEQDALRQASAEMGLPMPEEAGHSDPNATLLELDAVALKAKLAEQRAKLRRASEIAAEKWANSPASPATEPDPMPVNERSLDEVLLSYLDDE